MPTECLVPLWVTLAYTLFVAVLAPTYWKAYGPTNFLYFCDVALFLGLAAVWLESPLLASMAAVGILLPQMLWLADLVGGMVGHQLTGMTAYMFRAGASRFVRALSLFHGWLPFFLLWLVWRLGYDRRAFWCWTALAEVLLLICYFLLPPPPAPAEAPDRPVNVNYVYGLGDAGPQHWLRPGAYLTLLMVVLPVAFFLPAHLLLRTVFPAA
jgi:hypothetical protein